MRMRIEIYSCISPPQLQKVSAYFFHYNQSIMQLKKKKRHFGVQLIQPCCKTCLQDQFLFN